MALDGIVISNLVYELNNALETLVDKINVESDLNTDSIIIVSLNNETKAIKLLSVYRDTLLDVGNGNIQKCNSAYRRGGAKQAINMLNQCLDMNIQK